MGEFTIYFSPGDRGLHLPSVNAPLMPEGGGGGGGGPGVSNDWCIKNSQVNSRKIVPCADDQTTQTNFIQFHFRDSRFFYALFCCCIVLLFLLLKLLFSFFLMTFSVSTVQLSEFILFGGKQIILHFSRSLAIDSTCTVIGNLVPRTFSLAWGRGGKKPWDRPVNPSY